MYVRAPRAASLLVNLWALFGAVLRSDMTLLAVLGCGVMLFLNVVVPMLALRSLVYARHTISWGRVFLVQSLLAHVGISIGYHRYFSHRSFETSAGGKWLLASLGTLTMQGTPFYWAAQHRLHHRHCEDTFDPHSPKHGFWHAHGGFLTGLTRPTIEQHPEYNIAVINDLAEDAEIAQLARMPLAALHPALIMVGIPFASHVVFGHHATLWYLHVPQFLAWHATMSVNSATHTFGYALPASPAPCHARNVPWLWPPLLGEAWHANHHKAPHLASMEGLRERWWEVDLQFRLLCVAEWAGLVWNVKSSASHTSDSVLLEENDLMHVVQMLALPVVALLWWFTRSIQDVQWTVASAKPALKIE